MPENIRNFVIIAHIDHGKSTLADRFLEITGTIEPRRMKAQYLDQLELERERGITIKMAPVRMIYHANRRKNADSTENNTEDCISRNYAEQTENNAEDFLYKDLAYKIRGLLFQVRKKLGLGYKEQIYHNAVETELKNSGLDFESKKTIPILYEGEKMGIYQPDFIVENKVIIELKALPEIGKPQTEQIWSYLKGCDYKLALLVNFGSKDLEIKRIVYDTARHNDFLRNSALSQRESAVERYALNMIDTPGHPDFSYEVSRALAAVEGAILLVDATQGIQAQTLANFYLAKKAGLKIIGALNKVDLLSVDKRRPNAELRRRKEELAELIGCKPEEILRISAKTGEGVRELLGRIIEEIPAPQTYADNFLRPSSISARALIFDSFYDDHKGIVASARVFGGEFAKGDEVQLIAADEKFKIKELGYFSPKLTPAEKISNGEIGYIATGLKNVGKIKIGDTICGSHCIPLEGYEEPKPVVFVSFYPDNADNYENFKKALQRLKLQDSALKIEPDFNEVLSRGFKVGFLGKLHFEITVERLEREFKIKTINSFPSVAYKIRNTRIHPPKFSEKTWEGKRGQTQKSGQTHTEFLIITDPADLPDDFGEIWEPMIILKIISPTKYLGGIFQLKELFRMEDVKTENLAGERVLIKAKMPLAELIADFDDKLKSVSEGFASFSYEPGDYRKADLEKLEILVAGFKTSGLTRIVPGEKAEYEARKMVKKLKEILPRQQFVQSVQARVGGRIIARENVPALRKDVAGYLYGGDRTRKMKLWKKQKRGKEKLLKMAVPTGIPPETFRKMLQ